MSVHLSLEIDENISKKEIIHLMEISGFTVIKEAEKNVEAYAENLSMSVYWRLLSQEEIINMDLDPLHFSRRSQVLFLYSYRCRDECNKKVKFFLSHIEDNSSAFFVLTSEYQYEFILAIRDESGMKFCNDF